MNSMASLKLYCIPIAKLQLRLPGHLSSLMQVYMRYRFILLFIYLKYALTIEE